MDLATLPADIQLVKAAAGVVAKYYLNQKDPVNKQAISLETKNAAVKVVAIFSAIVVEKTARIAALKTVEGGKALKEAARAATPTSH